jgi:hypothetical protein
VTHEKLRGFGVSLQNYHGIELFYKAKPGGPGVLIPWIGGQWSTVDSGRRRPRGSPELSPGGVSGCQTSP